MSLCCPECGHEFRPARPMTRAQRRVYGFVERYSAEHGYSPSYLEIANGCGFRSLATVHEHLTNLNESGWLTFSHNQPRSIVLTQGSR